MKVLVTGGAGFIGSHVVDHLLDAGHEVAIVDDMSTGFRDNINPAASFHEVDICSDELQGVFEKEAPEAVCHLAAQINVTRSVADPVLDATVNVLGMVRLLQLCVARKVRRFVFSSTGGAIYGAAPDYPARETTHPMPMSPYATSKLSGEEYLKLYGRTHGLTYTVLRYTNVFGPRQIPHGECGVCAVLTDLMLAGKRPTLYGFGEPVRDYIYAGDVARANVLALEKGDNDVFNVCSGRPTTVMEIFEALKAITGFDQEPELKPLRPGEVEKSLCDNAKVKEAFSWQPTVGLEEGLRATVDHMRRKR